MMNGDYIRPSELVTYLGLSRGKVYRMIREGDIPSIRFGGSIVIPVEGLKRRLEAGLMAEVPPAEKDTASAG